MRLALSVLALITMLTPTSFAGKYKNFAVSVYCRAYEVREMKDLEWLKARWSVIEQAMKVDKVYLETHRDMIVPDEQTIVAARKFFEDRGIRVAGGITATVAEANRFQTFCYSNPEHRAHLKTVVEFSARLFDEVILDDFFFTNCKCEACIRAKGDKSWTRFRLDLMTDAARTLVIEPARKVNPRVKLVIKYPNWYEHYQFLGYNLETEPKLFDGIYTGTETRDPVYGGQHLQQYLGYSIVRYLENIKPGGNGGGWVDPANRRTFDRYAEQLWLTLFAKAPEVTLFDFRQLIEPLRREDGSAEPATMLSRVAGYTFDQVDGFLGKLGKPAGVKGYKPFHSSGEDFLYDYIGMLGVPIDLHPAFPADAKTMLLTESAKFDAAIVEKIKGQLAAGKNVVITSGLLKALQDRGIKDIAELEYTDKKAAVREFWRRGSMYRADTDIVIPQIRYPTNDTWETISTLVKGGGYPLLLQSSYAKGVLYVLVIPDNPGDLYALPSEALTQIKEILMRDLYVRTESPSQVGLFVYDNDAFIVDNFLPHAASVRIVTDKRIANLREVLTGRDMTGQPRGDKMVYETFVGPNAYRVFVAR